MTCFIDAFWLINYNCYAFNAGTPDKIANDCTFYAKGGAWVMVFNCFITGILEIIDDV